MSEVSARVESFVKSNPLTLIGGLLSILVGVTQSAGSTYFDAFYILVGLVAIAGSPLRRWGNERPTKRSLCYVTFAIAFGVLASFSRTAEPFLAGLCVTACLGILAGVGYRTWRSN